MTSCLVFVKTLFMDKGIHSWIVSFAGGAEQLMYHYLGRHEEAANIREQAIRDREEVLGPEDWVYLLYILEISSTYQVSSLLTG